MFSGPHRLAVVVVVVVTVTVVVPVVVFIVVTSAGALRGLVYIVKYDSIHNNGR